MPDAIDQSWGRITPEAAAAAGIKVIFGYLSHDPSKNWTPELVRAYHAKGIGAGINWESDAGRPLLGGAAGQQDSADGLAQLRALYQGVGYTPKSKVAIVYSCDKDVNSSQFPVIDDYYRETQRTMHGAGMWNGMYGEGSLVDHLHGARLTEVEWQTLAWSDGYISPEADLYQSSINNTIGGSSVDIDQIRHINTVGVWWPPGHPLDTGAAQPFPTPAPASPATKGPSSMFELIRDTHDGAVYAWAPGYWRHVPNRHELTDLVTRSLCTPETKARYKRDPKMLTGLNVTHDGAVTLRNFALGGTK